MRLQGADVLITGATGGIGHAIVRAIAAEGARVTLTGRRVEVLEPLAQEVDGRALACDLADREAVDRLVVDAGRVDVLVNNAALPASGMVLDYPPEHIDRALDVNLRAPIMLSRAFAPAMRDRGAGHIVFVSSLVGKSVAEGSSIYAATKFGLRGFSLGLREDLRPAGVGVSCIFPGFIRDAGMFAETGVELPRGVGTRSPDEVAAAVLTAIRRNRSEVDVAPIPVRIGAAVSLVAPELASAVSRRLGAAAVSAGLAEAQAGKR